MCIQNNKERKEKGLDLDIAKILQCFNVAWTTFFIIVVTLLVAVGVVITWSQLCCQELQPNPTNCTQVQIDYSCCKVKNFWNPLSVCIIKYGDVFEIECLERRYKNEEISFDAVGIGILEGEY